MGDGEPKELYYQVNIIGAEKPANYFHLRYSPQAVGELYVVLNTSDIMCFHIIQYLPVQYQIHHLVPLLQCGMSLHLLLYTANKVCSA